MTCWPSTKRPRRRSQECRAGKGPVLLELLTYRRTGHSRRDPCHYQPKDEREAWFAKGPIERFAEVLKRQGIIDAPAWKRSSATANLTRLSRSPRYAPRSSPAKTAAPADCRRTFAESTQETK